MQPETRPSAGADERRIVDALRAGSELAFRELHHRHSGAMLRVALRHVPCRSVAEEVVQEAWLGVLSGIHRFEGRSSLKTWIFRILTNRAISRAVLEARSVPFSTVADPEEPDWLPPDPVASVERLVGARDELRQVGQAIGALPERQREVVVLRDVAGCPPEEVCERLGISDGNQRVLLHRGRARLRHELGAAFTADLAA
jgi:RNA polymerase sigma-70 factor, ECF subfamily